MRHLLGISLLFILFLSNYIAKAIDQEPVRMSDTVYKIYTDDIECDNYIYTVQRYQPIYIDPEEEYYDNDENQDFYLETVVRDSSNYIAYYFSNLKPETKLTIYFLRKKDFSIGEAVDYLGLNDSLTYITLPAKEEFKFKYPEGMSLQFFQKYEQPLLIGKLSDSIINKLKNDIRKEDLNESSGLSDIAVIDLEDYSIYHNNVKGYYYSILKEQKIRHLRTTFITADDDFYKAVVFQTKDEKELEENIEFFKRFCLTLKLDSRLNHVPTSYYDAFLNNNNAEDLLSSVYKTNDTTGLKYLLDYLASSSKKMSDTIMLRKPDLEQEVYRIYESLYNPLNPIHDTELDSILKTGKTIEINDESFEYGILSGYLNAKYYLTQGSIDVRLVDTIITERPAGYGGSLPILKNIISNITINDFCPDVKFPGKRIIYLKKQLKDMFENFLRIGSKDIVSENSNSIVTGKSIRDLRQQFLSHYLEIVPSYWSRSRQVVTHPEYIITINRELYESFVIFLYGDNTGRCLLKKENGVWKIHDISIDVHFHE